LTTIQALSIENTFLYHFLVTKTNQNCYTMEYQFTLFDEWATKMTYDAGHLPELHEWNKQLHAAKQKVIRHFANVEKKIEDDVSFKLYINHHYKCLLKLIHQLYFVKDLYKELLLKSLEQIKFFFDLKFSDIVVQKESTQIMTTLSVEELALVMNTLIECDVLKVRSKKALAQSISKFIYFVGHEEKNISAEHFYNALFMTKSVTISKVLKNLNKIRFQLNKVQ
jgi:hypothetical protein